jgi:hypothetical protein
MDFHTEPNFKPLSDEKVTKKQLHKWSQLESKDDLIQYYYHVYPDEHYFNYPEFTVKKLGLLSKTLDSLLKETQLTRKHIRNWMTNQNLSVEDWIYVGW